jgi:hypothetical protein
MNVEKLDWGNQGADCDAKTAGETTSQSHTTGPVSPPQAPAPAPGLQLDAI